MSLNINNLTVQRDNFTLSNINLKIPAGTVLGLLGKNGAGKTTLIKAVGGQLPQTLGDISYFGMKLPDNEVVIKEMLVYLLDYIDVNDFLKVKQIIKIFEVSYNINVIEFQKLLRQFNIDENQQVRKLSKGQRRKLELIMILVQNKRVIMLDEPTVNIDPIDRVKIIDLIKDKMTDSKVMIYSSHITTDILQIADYIAIIDDGKIICMEEKEVLLEKYWYLTLDSLADNLAINQYLIGKKRNDLFTTAIIERQCLNETEHLKYRAATLDEILIHLLYKEQGNETVTTVL